MDQPDVCAPKQSIPLRSNYCSITFGSGLIRHDSYALLFNSTISVFVTRANFGVLGVGPINHSLSWTNERERSVHGIMFAKVWTPEDPRSVPGGATNPSAPPKQGHNSHYQEYSMD